MLRLVCMFIKNIDLVNKKINIKGVKNMKLELIYTNDYQDVYRIKDGVFLSVNKFTYTISNNVNR